MLNELRAGIDAPFGSDAFCQAMQSAVFTERVGLADMNKFGLQIDAHEARE